MAKQIGQNGQTSDRPVASGRLDQRKCQRQNREKKKERLNDLNILRFNIRQVLNLILSILNSTSYRSIELFRPIQTQLTKFLLCAALPRKIGRDQRLRFQVTQVVNDHYDRREPLSYLPARAAKESELRRASGSGMDVVRPAGNYTCANTVRWLRWARARWLDGRGFGEFGPPRGYKNPVPSPFAGKSQSGTQRRTSSVTQNWTRC